MADGLPVRVKKRIVDARNWPVNGCYDGRAAGQHLMQSRKSNRQLTAEGHLFFYIKEQGVYQLVHAATP
jgi:hypothetical protein